MKKISAILALVLVLAMVFSLTACAKTSIVGAWKYTMDFNKMFEVMESGDSTGETKDAQQAAAEKALTDTMKKVFEGATMPIILDLKEDNTFVMSGDEAAMKETTKKIADRLPEILPDLIAGMSGMTREEFEAKMKEANMTMDDVMEQYGGMFNAEDMVDDMKVDEVKGTYTFEDGKLVLTPEDKDEKPSTMTVELSAKELKVTAIESEDDLGESLKKLLPLVFTK